jgi:hypothetical protein
VDQAHIPVALKRRLETKVVHIKLTAHRDIVGQDQGVKAVEFHEILLSVKVVRTIFLVVGSRWL